MSIYITVEKLNDGHYLIDVVGKEGKQVFDTFEELCQELKKRFEV